MRVLLIEDDAVFADILKHSLIDHNYVVDVVHNGQDGLAYAQTLGSPYDMMVIDVGLPRIDGITLCQRLRAEKNKTPILLMTAKDTSAERIQGLDQGADDYLTKPFDLNEFHARIRALLRRGGQISFPILKIEQLVLNPAECQVTYAQRPLKLTRKEYGLLELLMRHPGRAFSRGDFIHHLWSFEDPPLEDTVKSHIKSLRQKLRTVGATDWIENIYGMGYRLNPKLAKPDSGSEQPVPSPQLGDPIDNPVPDTLAEEFQVRMAGLWQQHQGLILERLNRLQDFAQAQQSGTLTSTIQAEAQSAAHKLAGVLGMFGRPEDTQIASQLEIELKTFDQLDLSDHKALLANIQQLVSRVLPALNSPPSSLPVAVAPVETFPVPKLVQDWRILAVDDDPIVIDTLQNALSIWGMHVTGLADPRQFWPTLAEVMPDLVILDVDMPHVDGITLCHEIREAPDWQALPVIFLTRHKDSTIVQNLFMAGADDYVAKPFVSAELVVRITNRLERLRLLQSLSTKDNLTGLANYTQSVRSLTSLFQKHPSAYFVLLVWPQLHEMTLQYGHATSHQVLRQWGQLIRSHFTDSAVTGYWGNGEFVVGLPQNDVLNLSDRVQYLAEALQRQGMEVSETESLPLICQWAIVKYPQHGENLLTLYQTAYQRLTLPVAHACPA